MTRLLYLSPARFPSARAYARQSAEMCAAFADQGAQVTLAHPDLPSRPPVPRGVDLFDYYGLPRTFREWAVPCPGLPELFGPEPDMSSFAWRAVTQTLVALQIAARTRRGERDHIVFSLEKHTAWLIGRRPRSRRPGLVLEIHDLFRPLSARNREWLLGADALVAVHPALRDDLVEDGFPADGILVEPNGCRPLPPSSPDRVEAREALGLDPDARLVVYTGHLYSTKGGDDLVRAMARLPDATALLVGGQEADRGRTVEVARACGATNVRFVPHVPPDEAARYQAAADVLVLPTRPEAGYAARYTSPLKLTEYRAAGRPVVATDLPSHRAWLEHGDTAWLVPHEDPDALAGGLRRVLDDPELAAGLASRAREGLEDETWSARAGRILEFVRRRCAGR